MSRTFNQHVRLTEEENALLCDLSARTGKSKSEVLPWLLRGRVLIEAPPVQYGRVLVELRRIGVNLNQLTRAANTPGSILNKSELEQALTDLRATEHRLNEAFTPRKGAFE